LITVSENWSIEMQAKTYQEFLDLSEECMTSPAIMRHILMLAEAHSSSEAEESSIVALAIKIWNEEISLEPDECEYLTPTARREIAIGALAELYADAQELEGDCALSWREYFRWGDNSCDWLEPAFRGHLKILFGDEAEESEDVLRSVLLRMSKALDEPDEIEESKDENA
jgi:hypothetical protein